jgi:TolB protein
MNRKTIVITSVLTLMCLGMPGTTPVLSQQADIEIGTATGAQSVRLAVPLFPLEAGSNAPGSDSTSLTEMFNETLWNDLEFSGVFELVGRSFYPAGSFGNTGDILPDEWVEPAVDAQVVAFGHAEIDDNGQFFVESHLWDMKTDNGNRELLGAAGLGYRIEFTDRGVRRLAHDIADRIVAELGGGIRGIARTQIAFVSTRTTQPDDAYPRKEIWVMDYDGFNQQQLTTLNSTALTPRWAPDGRRLAFTHMSDDGVDISVISPIDRQGFSFPKFNRTTATPSWSPDGRQIVFSSSHGEIRGQPDTELYISDANGENVRRLTNSRGIDTSPVWNPATGRQIAFISDRSSDQPRLYIMDAEGGNLRQLTVSGHADEPSWSPDGRLIAYAWQPPGQASDIYIYDLVTDRNIQLTEGDGFNERPSWSPDGRHLVFQSDRNGTMQLYSMLANGSRVRRLTRQGNNEGPSWSNYVAQ